jgi:hypothetical protein
VCTKNSHAFFIHKKKPKERKEREVWRVDEKEGEEEEKRKECGSTLPLYAALNSLYSTSARKSKKKRNKNSFASEKFLRDRK